MEPSIAALFAHQWALDPGYFTLIQDIYDRRIVQGVRISAGDLKKMKWDVPLLQFFDAEDLSTDQISALVGDGWSAEMFAASPGAGMSSPKKIAVVNLSGVVQQKPNMTLSGPNGASADSFASAVESAVNDPSVSAVIGHFDSPGGSVFGIQEAYDKLRSLQGIKPMVAQINSLAASAAYWLACGFPKINITPGGQAGSIGVYTMHNDISGKMQADGVKPTFISAGKYKVEGHQFAPLDTEASQAMQKVVDGYYKAFTGSVAKARGVDREAVVNGFGQGRTMLAQDAVREGVADKVSTMEQTLRSLGSPAGAKSAMKAEVTDGIEAVCTSAAAFLPEMTPEQHENAALVLFHNYSEGKSGPAATFPQNIRMSASAIINPVGDSKISIGAGKLMIERGDASAIYSLKSMDRAGGQFFCGLISANVPGTTSQQAASDEWRRRKFQAIKRRANAR